MPLPVVKLVAILLLVVQGLAAWAPGRVLCIRVGDCGAHEQDASASCGHCDPTGCSGTDGYQGLGHDRGPFSTALHPPDECGCHVHLPVRGDGQFPSNPKSESPDLKTLFVPWLTAVVLCWEPERPLVLTARFEPPDFCASDQVLALKVTRLLI
jgi:hypothetical protein